MGHGPMGHLEILGVTDGTWADGTPARTEIAIVSLSGAANGLVRMFMLDDD